MRIVIDTRSVGPIDVTEDVESGNLTLSENSYHSLSFTLSNSGGKYSNLFTPDDAVVVQMKRIRWMQVFSGYLDTVPYFSVYNRSVGLAATCTLKRALYHWWDPGYYPALQDLSTALNNQYTDVDGGMSGVIKTMLTDFIGWDPAQIHIGTIPHDWMASVAAIYSTVQAEVAAMQTTAGSGVANGDVGTSGGSLTGPTWTNASGNPMAPAPGTQIPQVYGPATYYDLTYNPPEPPNTPGAITDPIPLREDEWWSALHWGYIADESTYSAAKAYLKGPTGDGLPLLVSNAATNVTVCVRAADAMGNADTSVSVIDLSPTAFSALGCDKSDKVNIAWAPLGTPSGPYTGPPATANTTSAASSNGTTATGGVEAANFVISKIGVMYNRAQDSHGGIGPNEPTYDCSSLVASGWQAAGYTIPGDTYSMWGEATSQSNLIHIANGTVDSNLLPGDLLFVQGISGERSDGPGHVGMYVGNDTVIDASVPGKPISSHPFSTWMGYWTGGGSGTFAGAMRVVAANGQPPSSTGTLGVAPGASTSGMNTANGQGSLPGGSLVWGNWTPTSAENSFSNALYGIKVLMNDTPIMPTLTAMVQTGLRSYCSAPNGDFIAWFPDYFGLYGYASKWILSPVEMLDFNIAWSDKNLVTHQFTSGSQAVGDMNTSSSPDSNGYSVTQDNMIQSLGVATIDQPDLFQILFNVGPGDNGLFGNPTAIYQQFGPRPNFTAMPSVPSGMAEFFFAVRLWMESWASQFTASVPLTFMPELYPGMLLVLPEFGFQAYITSLTHSWNVSDDGAGFNTSVSLIAPSSIATDSSAGLIGLARGA